MPDRPFPYPSHPLTPFAPVIVNVALTGISARRDRAPHVPLTNAEIADDAERCFDAGAAIVHVHVRDAAGDPEWRREAYADLIPEIRSRCAGIIVCATTSGRTAPQLAARADVLELTGSARPDAASLTLGSLNFVSGPSINDPRTIEALAERMTTAGIHPELEIFDLGMAHLAHRLLARGLLSTPSYANLMLGFHNGAPADARALVSLVEALPPGTVWSAGGFGAHQQPVNALAIAMGGHVRTGLEDNPYLDHVDRTPATNAGLVERVALMAQAVGRRPATCAEARELLGLAAAAPAYA